MAAAPLISAETADRIDAWWNNAASEPILMITAWDGAPPPGEPSDDETYWFDTGSRLDRELYRIEHTRYYGDAVPFLFVNFGPGVLGACMGGNYAYDRQTFWFTDPVLERLEDIRRYRLQLDNAWLRSVFEYTVEALDRCRDRALVSLTDIGGGMDVLAGLRGTEQLLEDLVLDPEGVKTALEAVYQDWWTMYEPLAQATLRQQSAVTSWNGVWSPETTYTLQNDFSCMISPDFFRAFDLPYLERLCGFITRPMYHLDGPGAVAHVDALLELENLRAIQWIPGSGAPGGEWGKPGGMEHWDEMLRRILQAGKSVELYLHPGDVPGAIERLGGANLLLKVACPNPARAEGLLAEVGR